MALKNVTNARSEWVNSALLGAVLIIVGALLAVYQKDALELILIVAGVLIIIGGVIGTLNAVQLKEMPIVGAIMIVFGIILALLPGLVSDALMVILAAFLIIYGLITVLAAFSNGSTVLSKGFGIVAGILSLVVGVYALFNLDDTADVVMIITGAIIIVSGILQLVRGYELYKEFH